VHLLLPNTRSKRRYMWMFLNIYSIASYLNFSTSHCEFARCFRVSLYPPALGFKGEVLGLETQWLVEKLRSREVEKPFVHLLLPNTRSKRRYMWMSLISANGCCYALIKLINSSQFLLSPRKMLYCKY
jgi:hypothetical protein